MGRLKAFADSRGICVLLVHHTRKSKNPEDSFDNINGSTGILGAADFTIVLDKQSRMDDEAGFLLTGRDIEQCERVIRFDKARCRWVMQGTAAQLAAQRRVAEYEAEPIVKTAGAPAAGGWNMVRQCAGIDADGRALYKRRACFQHTSIGRTNQRAATNALGKRCDQVLG